MQPQDLDAIQMYGPNPRRVDVSTKSLEVWQRKGIDQHIEQKYVLTSGKTVVIVKPFEELKEVRVKRVPVYWGKDALNRIFSFYGTIKTITQERMYQRGREGYLKDFDIRNGTYKIKMKVTRDIPSTLIVSDFKMEVFYRGQHQTCWRCGRDASDHKKTDCTTRYSDFANILNISEFPALGSTNASATSASEDASESMETTRVEIHQSIDTTPTPPEVATATSADSVNEDAPETPAASTENMDEENESEISVIPEDASAESVTRVQIEHSYSNQEDIPIATGNGIPESSTIREVTSVTTPVTATSATDTAATPATATPVAAEPAMASPATVTPVAEAPAMASPVDATPEMASSATATPVAAASEMASPATDTPAAAAPEMASSVTATPVAAAPAPAMASPAAASAMASPAINLSTDIETAVTTISSQVEEFADFYDSEETITASEDDLLTPAQRSRDNSQITSIFELPSDDIEESQDCNNNTTNKRKKDVASSSEDESKSVWSLMNSFIPFRGDGEAKKAKQDL